MASSAIFFTFTYDDDHVIHGDGGPTLVKSDVQLFFKRLRKINKAKIRYYAVGEYGTQTHRPHYHAILFNVDLGNMVQLPVLWSKGQIHVGDVTPASIAYVTKYVINRPGAYPGRAPPFALMSRRPGIGINYVATHMKWHRADEPVAPGADTTFMRYFTNVNGILAPLPRYYKARFFTPREREILTEEAQRIADQKFEDELIYLSQHHDNPNDLYNQALWQTHEAIKTKANEYETL